MASDKGDRHVLVTGIFQRRVRTVADLAVVLALLDSLGIESREMTTCEGDSHSGGDLPKAKEFLSKDQM